MDDPNAHCVPPLDDLKNWVKQRDEEAKQSLKGIEETKQHLISSKTVTSAALEKRRQREEKSTREGPSLSTPDEGKLNDTTSIAQVAAYTVTISARSAETTWYQTQKASYETLDAAKKAGIWLYPSTLREKAKCEVFKDLWGKGNYMGGGIKFGGDFLVYPGKNKETLMICSYSSMTGDPLRYHSHFVASVIESPISMLQPMQIVAYGRLGTGTKKAHLLCGWDEDTQNVSYFSLEWAGFG